MGDVKEAAATMARVEKVGRISTPAGEAALAPAAIKAQQIPPPAPPARLNLE